MVKEETRIAILETNHENLMNKIEEILTRFDKFEQKLDCALEKKADKTDVDKLETNQRWVVLTIVGAVILAVLNLVLK